MGSPENKLEIANTKLGAALRLNRQGQLQEAQRSFDEAEILLKGVIAEEPANAQAHAKYARLLESNRRYAEAEIEYKGALDSGADDLVRAAYEDMQKKREMPTPEPPETKTPSPPVLATPGPGVEESQPRASIPAAAAPSVDENQAHLALQEAEGYWALGILRLEQKDLAGAEEAFRQALVFAPRHVGALEAYSSLLLDQQRYTEARESLIALLEVAPQSIGDDALVGRHIGGDPMLLELRASLYAHQGNLAMAEPLLGQALASAPDRVEWVVEYTRVLTELGRSQEATAYLRDALARNLGGAALHREYARLLVGQRQYDEAEQHLREALKIAPDDPETVKLRDELSPTLEAYQKALRYMALARVKARQGATTEAENLFEEALKTDGNHLPALKAYAAFLDVHQRYGDAEKIWTILAGLVPEEAEKVFRERLETRGEDSQTLNRLARVLIQLDRLAESEARLRRSLEREPGNAETLRLLTGILEKQSCLREAEWLLRDNPSAVWADADLCQRYAQLLAARRDYKEVGKFYARAQELAPGRQDIVDANVAVQQSIEKFTRANRAMAVGWSQFQKGKTAEAEGRKDEAEKCYEEAKAQYGKALEIDSEHVDTLRRYAQLSEDTHDSTEASRLLARLAKIDPEAAIEHYRSRLPVLGGNVASLCAYGALLQDLGHSTQAQEQFRSALAIRPDCVEALKPYVGLLLQSGESRKAELALKRAFEQNDQIADATLHWQYGNLLIARHQYSLAEPHLARAVKLDPEATQYKEAYDQGQEELKQIREAELAYAQVEDGVVTDPVKVEALFQEARTACPDHIPTLVKHSEFLAHQGRREEAIKYLKEALEFDPYEELAAQLLSELEAVPSGTVGLVASPSGQTETVPQTETQSTPQELAC